MSGSLQSEKTEKKLVFTNFLLWEKDHIAKKEIQSAILTYIITDNPTEIFRQDFIQPQTPGEDYYKPSRSSYKHGTFDF